MCQRVYFEFSRFAASNNVAKEINFDIPQKCAKKDHSSLEENTYVTQFPLGILFAGFRFEIDNDLKMSVQKSKHVQIDYIGFCRLQLRSLNFFD